MIDAAGKYVTPGIIDDHSHLGVYAAPGVDATSDGNEATKPNTAEVWAEHSVWPQDPQFPRMLAGGVTTIQVLPGSANLFGGRSTVLKVVPGRTVQDMKFPGAPYGLKMACGENPKRVYDAARAVDADGQRGRLSRRLDPGRAATAASGTSTSPTSTRRACPDRDLALETLAEVLRGNILVHNHCYRADEMAQMLDIAKEFGYEIRSFHHVVEGYKMADRLAAAGVAASIWADWGGFKMEALDGVKANAAILQQRGRARDHPLRRSVRGAAPEPGSGQGDGRRRRDRPAGRAGGRDQVADDQPGVGARPGRRRSARSSRARTPTWCCGRAIRSASTRAPRRCGSTAPCASTACRPTRRWRTDFELGYVPAETR